MKKKFFTLIELIVVIAIIIVLAAAAFLILSNWITRSRDTRRISDSKVMQTGLETALIQNAKLPKPDNMVTLTGGGVLMGYQGYFGSIVSKSASISKEPKDPGDDNYYTYRTDGDLKKYQIMVLLENTGSIVYNNSVNTRINTEYFNNYSYAVDYNNRIPKLFGKELGIILSSTNEPIQVNKIGNTINIYSITGTVKVYLADSNNIQGTGINLQGLTQFLSNGYDAPSSCPENFISVPGNKDFNQAGFCVAKYEMKHNGGPSNCGPTQYPSDGQLSRNYNSGYSIVSKKDCEPIASIIQSDAIAACNKMGDGYHLITNNEWMTIARNIELVSDNWSSGKVGSGGIYRGLTNEVNSGTSLGCRAGNGSNRIISGAFDDTLNLLSNRGSNCIMKRQLKLNNGLIIWDLAGNVEEHVNKANTINGKDYDNNKSKGNICGGESIYSFYLNDGNQPCNFTNLYTYANVGPKTLNLNAKNGIGRIDSSNMSNSVSFRGGSSGYQLKVGIFSIRHRVDSTSTSTLGFRCAK